MKTMILFTFILSFNVLANEQERAIKGVQKAILSYPQVKKVKRRLEKKVLNYVPVEKETAGIIGGVALSASQGYVDTKVIKNMNIKVVGGDMRPDIRYNLKNGEAVGSFNINWGF